MLLKAGEQNRFNTCRSMRTEPRCWLEGAHGRVVRKNTGSGSWEPRVATFCCRCNKRLQWTVAGQEGVFVSSGPTLP